MKQTSLKLLKRPRWAVTLIELLVVVLIIGVLSTIATGVYTGQVSKARVAAAQDLIRQLEIAITRYEVDTGTLPPSGSGTQFPPASNASGGIVGTRDGSGYLQAALVHSISGNAYKPASSLWAGPYISFQPSQLASSTGVDSPGNMDVLDPWGNPVIYVRSSDYDQSSGAFTGGTKLFTSSVPGADPNLPQPNPYVALGETYYNSATYQLISYGPNGMTLGFTLGSLGQLQFKGAEDDDVNNFGY